jgi:hypothetical protein
MLVIYEMNSNFMNQIVSGPAHHFNYQRDFELGVIFFKDLHEFASAKINSGLYWFWIDLVDGRETVVALGGDSYLVADPSFLGSSSYKETLATDPSSPDPTSDQEDFHR